MRCDFIRANEPNLKTSCRAMSPKPHSWSPHLSPQNSLTCKRERKGKGWVTKSLSKHFLSLTQISHRAKADPRSDLKFSAYCFLIILLYLLYSSIFILFLFSLIIVFLEFSFVLCFVLCFYLICFSWMLYMTWYVCSDVM